MTVGEYFKCPLCGKTFCIKMQMDPTYTLYDWPIHVSCSNCGNEMDLVFNSNGLQPSDLKIDDAEQCITFGYSAVLPMTSALYYRDLSRAERMVSFSPFINYSFFYGKLDASGMLGYWVNALMKSLIPYRHYLKELYPLISHQPCNVKAFSAKLAALSEAPKYKVLRNENECLDAFIDLFFATYKNLSIALYEKSPYAKLYQQLQDFVLRADENQLALARDVVNKVMSLDDWLWDEALETAAEVVNEIQVLFPSMSFVAMGTFDIPSGKELYTMTVGFKKLDEWYASLFEALVHIMPLIVGLNNAMKNGDANVFVVDGNQLSKTMIDFSKLDTANRIGAISQDAVLKETFVPLLNTHIRNAIQHSGDNFKIESQIVEYHYDHTDRSKHDDFRLIDVGFMVFMQLLHLLEAIFLVTSMEKKLRNV